MGNGLFSCKGCTEFCSGRTRVEINNNLYGNYGEMNLDKSKSGQRIITNIFIPNCKVEFSPENSNINQTSHNKQPHQNKNQQKKIKIKSEKNSENDIKDEIANNNFNQFLNEAEKIDKNLIYFSPSFSKTTTMNNNINNNKNIFYNYNIEMLNYLNKVRNNPKSIIEDIDNYIKNNIKTIDNKEFFISEVTNEMVKINLHLDDIKDNLNYQKPVDSLKLNNKLKFISDVENTEITDKIIIELVINKKREIYHDYPQCFFYPIFIKDIKINIVLLLENNIIRDKIFNKDFSNFYATIFNEKSNRFFAIFCLA